MEIRGLVCRRARPRRAGARTARLSIAIAALALAAVPLHAWGPEGHRVVARLALAAMTPAATRASAALLGSDDFIASSTWADEIRSARPETSRWHFVDIPYRRPTYNPARDCRPSPSGDCIIAALARVRHDLTDSSLSADARREALKFLIHFVGDLHQPLHVIDHDDRGGNDVPIILVGYPPPADGSTRNLHEVWDSTILAASDPDDAHVAAVLEADLRARPRTAGPIDVVRWAEDAHRVAVEIAYTYPGFSPGGPPAGTVELGPAYQRRALAAIRAQLALAGIRLAAILNEAFP